MVRVIPEAGHEDDGGLGAVLVSGREDLVAVVVGHADVADHEVEAVLAGLFEGGHGLAAVLADNHGAAAGGEDITDDAADALLIVGDEDSLALEDRVDGLVGEGLLDAQETGGAGRAVLDAVLDRLKVSLDA